MGSPYVLVHCALSRIIQFAITEDLLDVVNLASFELIIRLLFVIELVATKFDAQCPPGDVFSGEEECPVPSELDRLFQSLMGSEAESHHVLARLFEQFILA